MIPFLSRTALAAVIVLAASTSAAAQSSVRHDSTRSRAAVTRSAPTIMAASRDALVAFRPAQQNVVPAVRRRESFSRPVVLMIVGAALIVTGIVLDDEASTVLYIAGAGIGGYGLYLQLQSPNARLVR